MIFIAEARRSDLAGRYEIISQLGEGGAGKVWLARDLHLEQFVAVKFARKDDISGAEALEREMKILRRIRHASIPRALDYGVTEETFYLVMDLVEGEPLGKLSCSGKQLMEFFIQLSEILSYLHEECDPPIVHGDIKPANLILDRKGKIHLIDYGTSGTPTTSCVFGTIGFAAPEQYRSGGGRIDRASDIYGMGVTFRSLADKGRIPLLFRFILRKCMRQDPTKRWKSAKVLTKALKRACCINAKKI